MRPLKTIALTAALSAVALGNAGADDVDALVLGGYCAAPRHGSLEE